MTPWERCRGFGMGRGVHPLPPVECTKVEITRVHGDTLFPHLEAHPGAFMVPGVASSGSPVFPGAPGDTSWCGTT